MSFSSDSNVEDAESRVLQKRRLSLERAEPTSFSRLAGHHSAFRALDPSRVPDDEEGFAGSGQAVLVESLEEEEPCAKQPSLVDVDAVEEIHDEEGQEGIAGGGKRGQSSNQNVLAASSTAIRRKEKTSASSVNLVVSLNDSRSSRFEDRVKSKEFCCVPHFIANTSQKVEMLPDNTQMILCSGGSHIIGVVAALLVQAWMRESQHDRRATNESKAPHATNYYYGSAKIMCVVIPDGMPSTALVALTSPLQSAIALEMKRYRSCTASVETPNVCSITEGLGTKERCLIYQQGGVVVGAGRVLCADILHRRLSPALTLINIFLLSHSVLQADSARQASGSLGSGGGGASFGRKGRLHSSATSSFAFFIDLINDGRKKFSAAPPPETVDTPHVVTYEDAPMNKKSEDFAFGTLSVAPSSVILCDEPILLQYLVQRHHRGFPHFTQQMRVGDIQIFPRFRLEIMQHYERMSIREAQEEQTTHGRRRSRKERNEETDGRSTFRVDRIQVPLSPSTAVLDKLLVKVLTEIWSELQQLQERLNRAKNKDSNGPRKDAGAYLNTGQFRQRTAQLLDEVNGSRFLPRSLSAQPINPSGPVNSYIRKVWRDPADPSGFRFDWMPAEIATDVSQVDLDDDLHAALRLNRGSPNEMNDNSGGREETEWPYRMLVESLLDVRQLRRDAQNLTPYAFLWSLEQALRLRRQRSALSATATAMWTLSSSFFDILTVATERIGSVVWRDTCGEPGLPQNQEDDASTESKDTRPRGEEEENGETLEGNDKTPLAPAHSNLRTSPDVTAVKEEKTVDPKKCTVIEVMDVDDEDGEDDVQIIESNRSMRDPVSDHEVGSTRLGNGTASSGSTSETVPMIRKARKRLEFAPNTQHALDPVLEIMMTMTSSWCRGVFRKASTAEAKKHRAVRLGGKHERNERAATRVSEYEVGEIGGALLIVCFGRGAVLRAVQRLSYGKDGYQQLQLNQFLQLYQLYHHKHHERGNGGPLSVSTMTTSELMGNQKDANGKSSNNTNRKTIHKRNARGDVASVKQEPNPRSARDDNPLSSHQEVSGSDFAADQESLPPEVLREQLWHFNSIAADLHILEVKQEVSDTTTNGSTQRQSQREGPKRSNPRGAVSKRKKDTEVDEDREDDDEGSTISDRDDIEEMLEQSLGLADNDDSVGDHRFLFSQAAAPPSRHSVAATSLHSSIVGASPIEPTPSIHDILLSQTLAPLPPQPASQSLPQGQQTKMRSRGESDFECEEKEEEKEKCSSIVKSPVYEHVVVDPLEEGGMGLNKDPEDVKSKLSLPKEVTECASSPGSLKDAGSIVPIRFDILQWSPSLSVVAARPAVVDENNEDGSSSVGHTGLLIFINGDTVDEFTLSSWLRGTHPILSRFTSRSTTSNNEERGDAQSKTQENVPKPIIRDVVLTTPNVTVLRMLETVLHDPHASPSFSPLHGGKPIRVRLLTTPLAEEKFKLDVKAEREAFESLAHAKATLTSTLLADRDSMRETAIALESGLTLSRRSRRPSQYLGRLGGTFFEGAAASLGEHKENPRLIFDDREFRSALPYALHSVGLDLVPLTLITADYVLSPEYAVERKSIPDYLQSLQSGRLAKQLAAMLRQYAHPICLIEFALGEPFRLLQSSSQAFARNIFVRTGKLMAKFPKVLFMWARNPLHAAGMMLRLKQTVAKDNVDPSAPHLTMSAVALQEYHDDVAPEGGGQRSNASTEAALAAARVLSCFPGVNPSNVNGVMQVCGSLMGLASVSKDSLLQVMTPEDAEKLYIFLHKPLVEEVE